MLVRCFYTWSFHFSIFCYTSTRASGPWIHLLKLRGETNTGREHVYLPPKEKKHASPRNHLVCNTCRVTISHKVARFYPAANFKGGGKREKRGVLMTICLKDRQSAITPRNRHRHSHPGRHRQTDRKTDIQTDHPFPSFPILPRPRATREPPSAARFEITIYLPAHLLTHSQFNSQGNPPKKNKGQWSVAHVHEAQVSSVIVGNNPVSHDMCRRPPCGSLSVYVSATVELLHPRCPASPPPFFLKFLPFPVLRAYLSLESEWVTDWEIDDTM